MIMVMMTPILLSVSVNHRWSDKGVEHANAGERLEAGLDGAVTAVLRTLRHGTVANE